MILRLYTLFFSSLVSLEQLLLFIPILLVMLLLALDA